MDASVNLTIKVIIQSFLPQAKIILFGSRARGDFNVNSDYDVLIVTPGNLSEKEKLNLKSSIRKSLIKALHKPVDVLLNIDSEALIKKQLPGHVVQWAYKEGVEL